jgi:predicted Zn finger-like uncharacterized protein
MSQVTRCPACGTRFKVVADQLRISQGWVRCGVCHEVFDASEDLQPLPAAPVDGAGSAAADEAARNGAPFDDGDIREFRESMWLPTAPIGMAGRREPVPAARPEPSPAPPPASVPAREPAQQAPVPEPSPASPAAAAVQDASAASAADAGRELPGASLVDEILSASHVAPPVQAGPQEIHPEAGPQPAPAVPQGQAIESLLRPEAVPVPSPDKAGAGLRVEKAAAPASAVPNGLIRESEPQGDASVPSPEFSRWPDSEGDGGSAAAAALPEAEPGFVRQARRKAFWRRPAVRVALLLGSVAGVVALAGQVMWRQRDALAVQHPALAPTLQALCAMAGCELQPRRQIGDVVIGSSGFRQLPRSGQYQWSLSLENRSDFAVAMPAVELTLTDAQDKLLLRRVIRLDQFGAPAQIEGHGEWSVTAPVEVQGLEAAVAGYRALVVYP